MYAALIATVSSGGMSISIDHMACKMFRQIIPGTFHVVVDRYVAQHVSLWVPKCIQGLIDKFKDYEKVTMAF